MAAWLRILCVGWLLGASLANAQEVRARIELTSGRSFVAEVLRIEPDAFVLRLGDRELVVAADDVATLVPLTGEAARKAAAQGGPAPWEPVDDAGEGEGKPADHAASETPEDSVSERPRRTPSLSAGGGRASAGEVSRSEPSPLGPDAHVVDLLERYLWVVPGGAGHLTSIGAGLMLLMSWLLMAAGRAVGLERIGFARCLGLSGAMLAILAIEASLLPVQPLIVGLTLLLDLGVFVVLAAGLLGARLGQATFVVAAFVFFSILLVMLSELVGVLLSARDLMGDAPPSADAPPAPTGG